MRPMRISEAGVAGTLLAMTRNPARPSGEARAARPDQSIACGNHLLVFDDFQHDFAVGARGDRIEDGANRLCGSALLADHASEVFLGDPQFKYRSGIALGLL